MFWEVGCNNPPVTPTIQYATASDGARIAYATYGGGPGTPLLVIAPPFLSHLASAQETARELVEGFSRTLGRNRLVVQYDPRGSGLSDRETVDWSFSTRLADVEAIFKATGIDHFSVYARLTGAALAVAYAANHPLSVAALACEDPVLCPDDLWRASATRALGSLIEQDWPRFAAAFAPPGEGELMAAALDGAAFRAMAAAELGVDVTSLLKELRFPRWTVTTEHWAAILERRGPAPGRLLRRPASGPAWRSLSAALDRFDRERREPPEAGDFAPALPGE